MGSRYLIASTQIKDFFGLKIGQSARRFLAANGGAGEQHFSTLSYAGRRCWQLGRSVMIMLCRGIVERIPGIDRGAVRGNSRSVDAASCQWRRLARSFGGIPSGLPHLQIPRFRFRPDSAALLAPAIDGGDAGRDRVADVGGGCGPHERRPAQSECGAGGTGRGEHCFADVWRAAGDGRDCADGDEYPLGREDAGGGDDPCADAAA